MDKFPNGFLWGGACAANQYEGGFNLGNKSLTIADVMSGGSHTENRKISWIIPETNEKGIYEMEFGKNVSFPKNAIPYIRDDWYYPSHQATDFYHHYKEDIAYMAEMGFKCYRMSIAWPRIYPDLMRETPNEEGLKFYDEIIDECIKYNIEPLITLTHFEIPIDLVMKFGGWANRNTIDLFVKFTSTVLTHYKDKVKYWLTFNEINMMEHMQIMTIGMMNMNPQIMADCAFHQFIASALTVKIAHEINSDNKVGMMLAYNPIYPETCDPSDQLLALTMRQNHFLWYSDVQMLGEYPNYKLKEYERNNIQLKIKDNDLELLKKYPCDYLSFSCYGSGVQGTHEEGVKIYGNGQIGRINPYLDTNAWGWTIDPHCLRIASNELYGRYRKPLFVVENGLGWNDQLINNKVHDDYRINYLRLHIQSMKDAINIDGIPIMGYTMWSAIDIVSAGTGEMRKRYGFVYVDMNDEGKGTLKRYKKDSFYYYKKVIETNGEDI